MNLLGTQQGIQYSGKIIMSAEVLKLCRRYQRPPSFEKLSCRDNTTKIVTIIQIF